MESSEFSVPAAAAFSGSKRLRSDSNEPHLAGSSPTGGPSIIATPPRASPVYGTALSKLFDPILARTRRRVTDALTKKTRVSNAIAKLNAHTAASTIPSSLRVKTRLSLATYTESLAATSSTIQSAVDDAARQFESFCLQKVLESRQAELAELQAYLTNWPQTLHEELTVVATSFLSRYQDLVSGDCFGDIFASMQASVNAHVHDLELQAKREFLPATLVKIALHEELAAQKESRKEQQRTAAMDVSSDLPSSAALAVVAESTTNKLLRPLQEQVTRLTKQLAHTQPDHRPRDRPSKRPRTPATTTRSTSSTARAPKQHRPSTMPSKRSSFDNSRAKGASTSGNATSISRAASTRTPSAGSTRITRSHDTRTKGKGQAQRSGHRRK